MSAQGSRRCGPDSLIAGFTPHARFAVLLLDYESLAFVGGRLLRFPLPAPVPRATGLRYRIPIVGLYEAPSDFGRITFRHAVTTDTVFDATIIAIGRGRIAFPDSLLGIDALIEGPEPMPLPAETSFLGYPGGADGNESEEDAMRALQAARALGSLRGFGRRPYEAGVYLYAPSVGMFDRATARWLVLLHTLNEDVTCRPRPR